LGKHTWKPSTLHLFPVVLTIATSLWRSASREHVFHMHEYKSDNISEGPDRAGLCESHKVPIADAFATSLAESSTTLAEGFRAAARIRASPITCRPGIDFLVQWGASSNFVQPTYSGVLAGRGSPPAILL
jgi:hypothetical protein